jgi:drug/metabolite transporter (DMT)-like permease
LLQVHGAVLLFGVAGLFGKLLPLAPVLIVFGRVVFASLALAAIALLWGLPIWLRSGRTLVVFLALGGLLALHWTTFFQAVQVSSVAVALLTFSTFPVFAALLEPIFFRERLHIADVLLAFLALVGVAVLMPSFTPGDRTAQGAFWGIASGLTFALLSLLNRKYVREYSSVLIALYQDFFAALALLPFALLQWSPLILRDVLLLLLLGLGCTAVAHSLFIASLRGIPARIASMIACLEPVYGSLLAALLLAEIPSVRTVLGGLIILAVAFVATVRAGTGGNTNKRLDR